MTWDPIIFSDMETSTQQGSACVVGTSGYSFGIYVIPSKSHSYYRMIILATLKI